MGTGCERSYREFWDLLADEGPHRRSAPMIRAWFGYEVTRLAAGFVIRDRDGREIDPLRVYAATQADENHRYDIYQLWMNTYH